LRVSKARGESGSRSVGQSASQPASQSVSQSVSSRDVIEECFEYEFVRRVLSGPEPVMLVTVPRFEPALPRRKKHPELAYKTHEFLAMSEAGGSDDSLDSAVTFDRARVSIFCLSCYKECSE
jgi:hypothetical protein